MVGRTFCPTRYSHRVGKSRNIRPFETEQWGHAVPIEEAIATRHLKAVWSDGSAHDVTIELGKPYSDGNSFRCPMAVRGLRQSYSRPDLGGFDELQAITLNLRFIRFLLEWHLQSGGQLYYPEDGSPYFPDDLPGMPPEC
jgi:hypothetical protein